MRAADPRQVACEVLRRVRRDGAYSNLALSAALQRDRLEGPSRRLATELVYGVLRHRRRLDAVIARHSKRRLKRINADVLDLLRVATYQLLLLDRVPAHAAVDQAVGQTKRLLGRQVAGFVNAVLRKVRREDWQAVLPGPGATDRLALEHSLPDSLAASLVAQLGTEGAEALGRSLGERAPLTVRCNPRRADREALRRRLVEEGAGRVEPGRHAPLALRVGELATPFATGSYLEGWWTAQDESAQLVAELVAPEPGETVLDACAGVGGKATDLAARLGDQGRVIATDINARKLQLLGEHCRRLGVTCEARELDFTRPGALGGLRVDRVLLDAPCSGLGVLRRHPELKWRADERAEDAGEPLVALQRRLLAAAAEALRPGGVLVYAVCTTTEAEGPEQAAWLLDSDPRFSPLPPTDAVLCDLGFDERGGLTLWTHLHDTDGFFLARFRKRT